MKIGIVGLGFVGLSLTSVLASKGYDIIGIDTDKIKCNKIINGISPFFEPELEKVLQKGLKKKLKISDNFSLISECDFIFVTVGTPQKANGSIDLSKIKNAITNISKNLFKNKIKPIIIIKSTVVPGTINKIILPILEKQTNKKNGKDFGLISNPEFLQETNAIKDTKYPHIVVLGSKNDEFLKKAKKLFAKLHPGVPIIQTNHQTAEMIKYANNSFLATKISFINQLSNICQKIPGANIDDIGKTIGLDPRIGKLFLNAGPGYGGSCLPKDMKALINFAKKSGVKPALLNAVEEVNSKQLEQIVTITKQKLGNLTSKKITILGTSFKPNTDDVRDSIAIELIKKFLDKKVKITVQDPKAIKNTTKIFGDSITYKKSIRDALLKSECVIIMTHWKQYEKISNVEIQNMKNKIIIDCRRILIHKKLNAEYYAIGLGNDTE
jgi:UDPglucose 6-dehydrogenase